MTARNFTSLVTTFAAGLLLLAGRGRAAEGKILFNRDIRPILAENCFACHGPDPVARKASLRLDQQEGIFGQRKEGPVVIPGKPEKSPLYQRLVSKDPDEIMPPPKSRHILGPAQIALFRRWIAAGAPWQPHWSLIAPERPPLPRVREAHWARNPIDSFVLAQLESNHLTPAAEADPRALVRRVSLDLTGLPPEPELVQQYLTDPSPDRYEKLVDRLLASPHYGEHRARYWLDAARYADTHGLNLDNYVEAWPYRDWVIDAFNKNMPFDRFTIEQIAGDLLPQPTPAQRIATGFHRCNITTSEGGTIPEELLANYARDRVETTSWVWLGLTANCAVCHDHKFDPITTKDFYAMSAFFRNTTQEGNDLGIRDTKPVLVLPASADTVRWAAIGREIATAQASLEKRRAELAPEFQRWAETVTAPEARARLQGNVLAFPLDEGAGKPLSGSRAGQPLTLTRPQEYQTRDGKTGPAVVIDHETTLDFGDAADFEWNQPFSVSLSFRKNGSGTLLSRVDPKSGFRGWSIAIKEQDVYLYLVREFPAKMVTVIAPDITTTPPSGWKDLTVTYDGSGEGRGVRLFVDGQALPARVTGAKLSESIRAQAPLQLGRLVGRQFFTGAVQNLQIFDRALTPLEIRGALAVPEAARSVAAPPAERTAREKEQLLDVYLAGDSQAVGVSRELAALEAEKQVIQDRSTVSPIQEERMDATPAAHVLRRGQYDQPGDQVAPGVFSALPPLPPEAPRNRLGLARWLVARKNPLTARVTVNRLWQEIFGTGLVKTAEDFGIMGEAPSHPQLLDWLAVEFMESGWDVKHLVRLLVTSATYRQAAVATPEKRERDPQNRLLAHGPRFRMDAEMIRDYALAASGELAPTIGGASVKPYQPEGVWEAVAIPASNTRSYQRDSGEALYRRSLYTFWKRSAPPASLEAFNAPTRETSCLRRERTDTPLQALVTLNDPQFVEAARVLATHALAATAGDAAKTADYIAERLLARPLRPAEAAIVTKNQQEALAHFTAHPDDAKALLAVGEAPLNPALPAPQLAAWTMIGNQLLNLDEVLNK